MQRNATIRLHYPRVALADVGFTQGPRPLFYERSLIQPIAPLDPTSISYSWELEEKVLQQSVARRSALELEQKVRQQKRTEKIERQRREAAEREEKKRREAEAAAAAEAAARRAEEERIERELQAKRDAEKAKLKAELERMEALKAQLEKQEKEDAERERLRQERLAAEAKNPVIPIPAPAYQSDRMDVSPRMQPTPMIAAAAAAAAASVQQTNTLNSFKNVTGVVNDTQCVQLLSLLTWDLTRAIAMFFDEGDINKAIIRAQQVHATRIQAQQPVVVPVVKETTTLKLIFPDNSMLSCDFTHDDTLWIVTERVAAHIAQQSSSSHHLPPAYGSVTSNTVQWHTMVNGNFSLVCLHPYQVYSESHLNQTLKEAGLVPNGTLRVQQGITR